MDRRWIVHITDLDTADGVPRCVLCARPLLGMHSPSLDPGTLLAFNRDDPSAQERRILDRDDLAADEMFCDRLVLHD